jgi:microcystin-dependent protein
MEVFVGTVLGFGFNFAPRGWAMAAGQLIGIQQNSALFSLLGTTYGGNGTTNFQLPNLVGRTVVGWGNNGVGVSNYVIGQVGGTENTTLLTPNMPAHNHLINVNTGAATTNTPAVNTYFGAPDGSDPGTGNAVTVNIYTPTAPNVQLSPNSVGLAGQNIPFSNLQPYLAISYCIALEGIFPSRN